MDPKPSDPFLTQADPAYHCGKKAEHLFHLQQLGFRVPPFVVLPWEFLKNADQQALETAALSVSAHFQAITSENQFAVRSSGVAEDGAEHSFAGQFETCLNVKPEQLAEKIAEVKASAFNERISAYRKSQGLEGEAAMAVIVQVMLLPEVSGVAFGANPVNGNTQEKMISAVYGLGEGLVGGLLDADTYIVDHQGNINERIVAKTQKMGYAENGGTELLDVEAAQKEKSSLNATQLRELAAALDKLETHYQHPQDVEFAWSGGRLYLLQTRAITTLKKAPENTEDQLIWDNSNIVESYPGHTSPLTFAFIIKMYEGAYFQMLGLMGVSNADAEKNRPVLANMLGLIEGRVYYNLLNWYKALAILPGFSLNASFMEKMMGVKERFELKDLPKRSGFAERLRVLNLVRSMLSNWWALPAMRRNFEQEFEQVMQEYHAIDFDAKNAWELMALYQRYEQTVLKKWKAPLINDFFTMIFFGVLQKVVQTYGLEKAGVSHNDLLCGARDIVSTEPVRLCLQLAADIQKDAEMKKAFLEKSPQALEDQLKSKAFSPNIQTQIEHYLDRWGDRCVGELKLETLTYRQQATTFLQLLQSYVRQGIQPSEHRIDLDIRENAENLAHKALKGKPLRNLVFQYILKNTRELVSGRENLRFARTRAYGVIREIFCALGKRFQETGLLESDRDIFYLTPTEIFDHVKGSSVNGDLKAFTLLRKRQYEQWQQAPPPAERFATRGIVYAGNDFRLERNPKPAIGVVDSLQGLGCCPGKVRAKVQVVRHPSEIDDLNGDILVTTNTDPGWVTLFPTAGAILVEKGSLLSHSAIVSREMGIPCIVGVTGLLQILKTGDLVDMDGSSGLINILEKA